MKIIRGSSSLRIASGAGLFLLGVFQIARGNQILGVSAIVVGGVVAIQALLKK